MPAKQPPATQSPAAQALAAYSTLAQAADMELPPAAPSFANFDPSAPLPSSFCDELDLAATYLEGTRPAARKPGAAPGQLAASHLKAAWSAAGQSGPPTTPPAPPAPPTPPTPTPELYLPPAAAPVGGQSQTLPTLSQGTSLAAVPKLDLTDFLSAPAAFQSKPGRHLRPPPPHIHISGFDPCATGGRQIIKMELAGIPAQAGTRMELELRSELIEGGRAHHVLEQSASGTWCPVAQPFSSRQKEHGQYPITLQLCCIAGQKPLRRWECTPVIMVPRPDMSVAEIHQIYLGSHKKVNILSEDASIAKVSGHAAGIMQMDVVARNAGLAQVDISGPKGRYDVGFGTIAWDEDLIEISLAQPATALPHPCPSHAACLVAAAPKEVRHLRLFALRECVLGRLQQLEPEADILLAHYPANAAGPALDGLTTRVSGRHALLRRTLTGFEVEDVSRYGLLVNGEWPGKGKPVALKAGMTLELSASFPNTAVLRVAALLPHALVLQRMDGGLLAECFYLMEPEMAPSEFQAQAQPQTQPQPQVGPPAQDWPLLFHRRGGFWHLDGNSRKETALAPGMALERLAGIASGGTFTAEPYPDCALKRYGAWRAARGEVELGQTV